MELRELLMKYGEPWRQQFEDEFGIESADRVADFFNNGGLELDNNDAREHCAVVFVSILEGSVDIGCWVWRYGEDFDEDAEWRVLELNCFHDWELQKICDKIVDVYERSGD